MTFFSAHFKPLSSRNFNPSWIIGTLITLFLGILFLVATFFFIYQTKIYPGIFVDQIDLSAETRDSALKLLQAQSPSPPTANVLIFASDSAGVSHQISTNSASLIDGKNYQQLVNQAFLIGKQGNILSRLKTTTNLLFQPRHLYSHYQIDQNNLKEILSQLKHQIDQPAVSPAVILTKSNDINSLNIDEGKDGLILDLEKNLKLAAAQILNQLNQDQISVEIEMSPVIVTLTQEQIENLTKRTEKFINRKLILSTKPTNPDDQLVQLSSEPIIDFEINDQMMISFLDIPQGFNQQPITQTVQQWAEEVDQQPVNAEFDYDPETLQVNKFRPDETGKQIDQNRTANQILKRLKQIEQQQLKEEIITDQLELEESLPQITLAQTNDLGINELIGFGDSHYDHSISSRIHNVKITADKLSLTIVPPEGDFSFNQTIGEVSRATGYQPAYIIRNGRTMLGDGGGVCQVSTTLFRALLDAGLDITRRLPHSYRVSYYELDKKPGFDATVYSGNVDLRFKNDTGHHLLIYSQANSDNLYMKVAIYGFDDGRTTEIANYKQWGYQPPPPSQYIPDASLAPGQLKQIDWSASGIKAKFDWIVRDKNGQIIREKTFHSNYRPWSAKYLQGI